MPAYRFERGTVATESPVWAQVLRQAHADKEHPLCLCRPAATAPAMYVARHHEVYLVKRMPYSGSRHATHCEHYEPPPELSGLGQVAGSAIREDNEREITTLNLDFALTKGATRSAPVQGNAEHESVRSDGTKLTLRATLHYLYDEAALTRWTPAMRGKRSWAVVRRELVNAASGKVTKGSFLNALLYVPESFKLDDAENIRARRARQLARLGESAANRMLIVAPIKDMARARFGYKLMLKHLPDMPLSVADDLYARIQKNFANQLALWNHFETSHLLLIGTFSQQASGVYGLESACLANVTEQWVPFDSAHEHALLHALTEQGRRFVKGLRYNLPTSKPLASAILVDTEGGPTATFLVPTAVAQDYEPLARELAESSGMKAWWWNTSEEAMPGLPGVHHTSL